MSAIPPVSIAYTELRHIRSAIIGQDYLIKIRIPEDYADTSTQYPVLYLLDGDHAFAMATDIVQYLIYGNHIPDLIIISPAYGSKRLPEEGGMNMRERDLELFPLGSSNIPPVVSQYPQFFQQELMPYVETTYRINSTERIIWGYSLGVLFVLNALFQTPSLFKSYIAVDGFDEQFVEMEAAYAMNHTTLAAKLCLLPRSDKKESMSSFLNTLKERNYGGLQLEYAELSDIGHFAVGAEGLTKGLVMAFRQ